MNSDLENQERFNNKSLNTYSNKSSSYRDRKKPDERISLYNLNVPLSLSNISQFAYSFEKAKTPDYQIQYLSSLLKASPECHEKFAESRAIGFFARMLSDAAFDLPNSSEIVEKSLQYLSKINLTKSILTKSRVHQAVENVKNCDQASEELKDKSFRLYVKWRNLIDEWISEDGELEAKKYEKELQQNQKNYIRNKNRSAYRRDRSSSASEEKSPKDKRRKRRDSPRRSGKDEKYNRKRNNREVYDDDYQSDRSSNYSDSYSDRKGVYWKTEEDLVSFKYFLATDEPAHPGLTDEEVRKIQEEIMERQRSGFFSMTPDELKHKESRLEGNSMKLKKDNEREIQLKLDAITESIKWYEPKNLKLDDIVELGKLSIEKQEHEQRIMGKLPSVYAKEYQIPDQPSFDSVTNKSLLHDRPVTIPLCNADGEEDIATSVKHLEQKKPEKNDKKSAKPLKSILKKTQKEFVNENEDNEKKQAKKLNIEPEIVLRLFTGEHNQDDQELFSKALKESGRSGDIIKNIETLKKFLENVQKIKASEKAQNSVPEPRKLVKTNEEPDINMFRNLPDDPFQAQAQLQMQQNMLQDMQDSGSPGDGNKKVSYKPHNYKTVPCVFFHSNQGCSRGDNCHFIHDWNYGGRETPNMRKYVRNNLITKDNPNGLPIPGLRTGSDIPLERPPTSFPSVSSTPMQGGGDHYFPPQQQHQHQQQHIQQTTQQFQMQQHQQPGHYDHHNQRPHFNQNQRGGHQQGGFNQQRPPMNNQYGGHQNHQSHQGHHQSHQMGRPQQQPPIRSDMMFQQGPPIHGHQPYSQPPNFYPQQQFHHQQHQQHQQGNMHMGGNMQNRHMMNNQHRNYGS